MSFIICGEILHYSQIYKLLLHASIYNITYPITTPVDRFNLKIICSLQYKFHRSISALKLTKQYKIKPEYQVFSQKYQYREL